MMAERPVLPVITMPVRGKKGMKVASVAMVLNSLTSTLPIVVPDVTPHLEDSVDAVRSAPNSPEREGKKKKRGLMKKGKKHLPRPNQQPNRTFHSDPESSSPSPQSTRPSWLPFMNRKKRSLVDLNNGEPLAQDSDPDPITSSGFPEATPVEELPGRTHLNCSSNVPEIRVSSEGYDQPSGCLTSGSVTFEEISGSLDPYRKNSQSSRCSSGSGLVSVGTSGIGSCLSPSGDESYPGSDLESPLSPCSFTEDATGDISDPDGDPIGKDLEKDLYPVAVASRKSPSGSITSNDNLSVTTPTPSSESPPMLVSPTSPDSDKELKLKRKRERFNKNVWMKVRNAVKAWSPFRVQFKKKSYPWVQLAGHEGNFMPGGENGTIMKKSDMNEQNALRQLLDDSLRNFVPEFKREVEHNGHVYVEMTDLLREFNEPAVMDIKMGVRTYLEEELGKKNVLRNDMYLKMIEVDHDEPTEEEHAQEAITKPRYMQWRESLSSTSTMGFRIEGIKTTTGKALKDFKRTKSREDVKEALQTYLTENPSVKGPFYKRLLDIKAALETSVFFTANELIGSSLLFVYDSSGLSSVNMIDFGKTTPLPEGITVTHNSKWMEGNHEDGYLYGLDNLIRLWRDL